MPRKIKVIEVKEEGYDDVVEEVTAPEPEPERLRLASQDDASQREPSFSAVVKKSRAVLKAELYADMFERAMNTLK